MRQLLIVAFTVFALYYVFFLDTIQSDWHMVFKLIPMLLLLILALSTKVIHTKRYKLILCIGLLFCAIGDYALQWFLIGLSSFLIGHLFYIAAFRSTNTNKTPRIVNAIFIVIGLCFAARFIYILTSADETILAIAVVLYICVILFMGMSAFRVGSNLAIGGAILFIISDTVLAFNRFDFDVPFSHEIIMFTYYGAQLCFTLSIAQYDEIRAKMVQ